MHRAQVPDCCRGHGRRADDDDFHAVAPPYDVLIRNGRVLDGSGNPWIAADIGIRSGRIVDMGEPPHLFAAKRVCTL